MVLPEGAGVPVVLPTGEYKNEYGFIGARERLEVLAPAPSVDPSEIDRSAVTEPSAGIVVWVALVYPDGVGRTVKAFAQK